MPKRFFIAALLVLSSCGHPVGVMTPIALTAAMPKTSQVDMLVATTREPSGNAATLFNGERSPKPYMTDVSVSIPPKRAAGTVQWPSKLPPNPATDFAAFLASTMRMVKFTETRPVTHILGNHIEQTATPFVDYPTGTVFQPNEHRLELGRSNLLELLAGLEALHGKPAKVLLRDITIYPQEPRPAK